MNTITVIAIAAFLVLLFILYITATTCKKLQEENTELKEDKNKQQRTIAELLRHAEEISIIVQDKGKVENEIKKAKTDEELVNIANAIISINNDRVRK